MSKMNNIDISPMDFYSSYPTKVINRLGYPARAVFKSTWLWKLFGENILKEIDRVDKYADIGGCFGFGANAMAFHIEKQQGSRPLTMVFEISAGFIEIGSLLFPEIQFFDTDFSKGKDGIGICDLVTMFDVVEHIVEPGIFLSSVAARSRFVILKTPMETPGEWRCNLPPIKQGEEHGDGHINFFSPKTYEKLLMESGFEIIDSQVIHSIVPFGAEIILCPEEYDFEINKLHGSLKGRVAYSVVKPGFNNPARNIKHFLGIILRNLPGVSWRFKRKLFGGGDHLALCRSRLLQ